MRHTWQTPPSSKALCKRVCQPWNMSRNEHGMVCKRPDEPRHCTEKHAQPPPACSNEWRSRSTRCTVGKFRLLEGRQCRGMHRQQRGQGLESWKGPSRATGAPDQPQSGLGWADTATATVADAWQACGGVHTAVLVIRTPVILSLVVHLTRCLYRGRFPASGGADHGLQS